MVKRATNTASTRERLIDVAVSLYGSRTIDAVSLREIGQAAEQKNPNVLQYHFGDRNGLLQAIVDRHASRIGARREAYFERASRGEWPPAEAVSRCLLMPILDYVAETDDGLDFVCILSQLASAPHGLFGLGDESAVEYPRPAELTRLFAEAFPDLPAAQAQQRIYLVVDTAFHASANIFRSTDNLPATNPLADREAMCEQLLLMIKAFVACPAL